MQLWKPTGAGEQNSEIEITEITELMTKIHLAFYGSLSSEMSQSEERRVQCWWCGLSLSLIIFITADSW